MALTEFAASFGFDCLEFADGINAWMEIVFAGVIAFVYCLELSVGADELLEFVGVFTTSFFVYTMFSGAGPCELAVDF